MGLCCLFEEGPPSRSDGCRAQPLTIVGRLCQEQRLLHYSCPFRHLLAQTHCPRNCNDLFIPGTWPLQTHGPCLPASFPSARSAKEHLGFCARPALCHGRSCLAVLGAHTVKECGDLLMKKPITRSGKDS